MEQQPDDRIMEEREELMVMKYEFMDKRTRTVVELLFRGGHCGRTAAHVRLTISGPKFRKCLRCFFLSVGIFSYSRVSNHI
ncbi:hypothetical protein RHGRI_025603 [Rhododendron griersonianum]|uniref:Ribosomal protein S14 n=1 Tax=Rhododendron griersonianum TaxID=479676 RepID=A0AAV6IPW3_9ERIC|nr:hypothetical protein RHGRI_025603 [Rhododendron griersonianum]